MFCRYALRTTDLPAARAFYADAIGLALPEGVTAGSALEAWPLHERARAAGAPAHWLGLLAVDDVDAAVKRLVEQGSEPLGPIVTAQDGARFAVLRDPLGAVIGVRARAASVGGAAPVVWHQLHTSDMERSWSLYSELFGWSHARTLDVPNPVGGFRSFAWRDGGAIVGAMGNTARWPGVHPHWLFCLPVPDVDDAASQVRAHGGTAMEPVASPDMRIVACEDPQGAAFGLAQSSRP